MLVKPWLIGISGWCKKRLLKNKKTKKLCLLYMRKKNQVNKLELVQQEYNQSWTYSLVWSRTWTQLIFEIKLNKQTWTFNTQYCFLVVLSYLPYKYNAKLKS